ncbi:type II toxin-antitoxin system HicA family toxin [Rickettsia asembonensis]|uniref:type II toxin-antitoxin system HicA family toxin n=1 Tax=Rickettsia asembonensis TaxID=1068590 RepID=UPI000694DDD8|nr:type II toxin-antitoxin system HicA family toxin [Rickettsia asembonensis]
MTWDELTRLFGSLHFEEIVRGKTGGSRRKFYNKKTGLIINLHKPHPQPIIKSYLIEQIIKKLEEEELI